MEDWLFLLLHVMALGRATMTDQNEATNCAARREAFSNKGNERENAEVVRYLSS